jgi:ferrous iron transport protein B
MASVAYQISSLVRSTQEVVALVGNPNCGKTSLFNRLTGSHYKVANYPGVTVEERRGSLHLQQGDSVTLVDLPGIYSLSGISPDEKITLEVLQGRLHQQPAITAVVSLIDSTNLDRNLYLMSEIFDLGILTLVVLNMTDLAITQGISIKTALLERLLGTRVICINASTGEGLETLKKELQSLLTTRQAPPAFQWVSYCDLPDYVSSLSRNEEDSRSSFTEAIYKQLVARRTEATTNRSGPEDTMLSSTDFYQREATARYKWIRAITQRVVSITPTRHRLLMERVDHFLTHPVYGTSLFILTMIALFQAVFLVAAYPMDLIDSTVSSFGNSLKALLPESLFRSLLVDGIVAGVGGVLVFIPQIAILFFLMGILEDTGYLARAAYLMDRLMRKVGLQGRSFIPLLSSFACAIPGIMATRTIPSFADRMTTIMVAPLMSCSARLPVYTLLVSVVIPDRFYLGFISLQGLTLLGLYLAGILGAALVAILLRKWAFRGKPSLFVMEMPSFRSPCLALCFRTAYERISIFVRDAGTVIFACSIVLWALATFPHNSKLEDSYAGHLGKFIEPLVEPLGYNWELAVAIIGSFAAREVFVSSLATVYKLSGESELDEETSLLNLLHAKRESGSFSVPTGISLLVFYIFACQCISTLAVMARETGSWRWPLFAFTYMTAMAYGLSFLAYRFSLFMFI